MKHNNNITIHKTEVNLIQGGVEFICKTCGYHATYTTNGDGSQHLKILSLGTQQENNSETLDPEILNHLELQVETILKRHFEEYGEL